MARGNGELAPRKDVCSILGVRVLVAVALLQELLRTVVGSRFGLERVAQGFEGIMWHGPSLCERPSVDHDLFPRPQQPTDVGHAGVEVGEITFDGPVRGEEQERHPAHGLVRRCGDGQGIGRPL